MNTNSPKANTNLGTFPLHPHLFTNTVLLNENLMFYSYNLKNRCGGTARKSAKNTNKNLPLKTQRTLKKTLFTTGEHGKGVLR